MFDTSLSLVSLQALTYSLDETPSLCSKSNSSFDQSRAVVVDARLTVNDAMIEVLVCLSLYLMSASCIAWVHLKGCLFYVFTSAWIVHHLLQLSSFHFLLVPPWWYCNGRIANHQWCLNFHWTRALEWTCQLKAAPLSLNVQILYLPDRTNQT